MVLIQRISIDEENEDAFFFFSFSFFFFLVVWRIRVNDTKSSGNITRTRRETKHISRDLLKEATRTLFFYIFLFELTGYISLGDDALASTTFYLKLWIFFSIIIKNAHWDCFVQWVGAGNWGMSFTELCKWPLDGVT